MLRLLALLMLLAVGCSKPDGYPTAGTHEAFDPSAFGPREAPPNAPMPDPELLDYGPRGDGLGLNAVGQVHLRFTHPVVPLGTDTETDALRVTRAGQSVPGRAYWQSPTQLVFEAANALVPATRYDVVWDGIDQLPELAWSFETDRPSVQLMDPVDRADQVHTDRPVLLSTTIATTAEQLRPNVRLTANGRPVATTLRPATEEEYEQFGGRENMLFGLDHDPFVVGAKVQLTITPGWRSTRGPLPASKTYEAKFEVHPAFSVTAVTCWKSKSACPIQPLQVELSTPVAEGEERLVTMRPKPPQFKVTRHHDTLLVDGRFVPGTTYTLTIDERMKDAFGQSLADDTRVKLDFQMPPPEVYLTQSIGNVLDDGEPRVGVSSRHVRKLRVRAARVAVDTYRDLYFADRWNLRDAPPLAELGKVVETMVDVRPRKPTNWGSSPIDFDKLLGDYRGPVAIEVTALDPVDGYESEGLSDRGLFHFGSLAPHVFVSTTHSVVRVEDLASRKPVPGATVSLLGRDSVAELGKTDSNGLLQEVDAHTKNLPLSNFTGRPSKRTKELLLVRAADGDTAILPVHRDPGNQPTSWLLSGETIQAKLVTERGVYRPGDDVYVTGWAALSTPHHPTGHRGLPQDTRIRLELVDRSDLVLDQNLVDNQDGRFSTRLRLPASARLGHVTVRATFERQGTAAEQQATVSAQVKEFRTPEFEVRATASTDQLTENDSVTVDIESRYYSGSIAEIRETRATRSCWTTSPPVVDGWALGVEHDWSGTATTRLQPKTVGPGRLSTTDTPGPNDEGKTRRCDYSFTVQNPSFQEEGAGVQLDVHPTSLYLGMPWPEGTPHDGDPLDLRFALFDVDGQRANAPTETVDVTIVRTERRPVYAQRGGDPWVSHYDYVEAETTTCRVRTNGSDRCGKDRLVPGTYEITAVSRKDKQRRFKRSIWVYERWHDDEPRIEIDAPSNVLPTDKMTAVTIRTEQKHGLLLVERFGIIEAIPFETRNGRAEVPLKPERFWAPGITVTAHAIQGGGERPELVSRKSHLDFDASDRELQVAVTAPPRASIREEVEIAVDVSGAEGPVNGTAAVWVVDDAILDLTNYRLPDLVRAFYPKFVDDVSVFEVLYNTLPLFVAERWDPYSAAGYGYGMGGKGVGRGGGGLGMAGTPQPRADFRATPFFEGHVVVAGGKARISFKLPDNITRFRVMAVVSAKDAESGDRLQWPRPALRFGSAEATIDVSAPLVVRPALPRFVRPGDAPELAAVVANTTAKAGDLTVAIELDGDAIQWQPNVTPTTTRKVAAGGELRVGFPARVVSPGTSNITVHARFSPQDGSAASDDAVILPLTSAAEPTLTQTVAMYGNLDDDGAMGIPVRIPDGAKSDVGGVSVTLTSTLLGGLRDATQNLITYPYGCAEQTSSRMLPLVALSDLSGFVDATEIPDGRTVDEFVADGIDRLVSMQHDNGGFGYWPSSKTTSEYVSAYVTWVLWQAKQAGHSVPEGALTRALDYLEDVVKTPDEDLPDSVIYYSDLRRAIAVYTLAEAGRKPIAAIDRLLSQNMLPVFARAFAIAALAAVRPDDDRLSDELRRLTNKITETPGSASVVETPRYDLGAYFHSDLRSSAIAMIALTRAKPEHPVVVKLARGLMDKRYKGAWRNTQENAYALVALADYARHYEREEPNFEVKVWVDNAVLVDDRWSGRSSKSRTGTIPMPELSTLAARTSDGTLPLNIRRRGEGRAYYRLAMTYAPTATKLPPMSRGIEVRRTFRREGAAPTDEMPTTLEAGEVFAIDVSVHTKSLLRYVAIDLPVPAGLEPIDLGLGSRKTLPMGGTYGWWTSHVEHHNDRVVMFADTLHPGAHIRTVYLRATTPGQFSFPPTHAEAMYTPEVFGRSAGGIVDVKE